MQGRRRMLARFAAKSGLLAALDRLPVRPGLLLLNYHRIGNPAACSFDRAVFSTTAEMFERQLDWLKGRFHLADATEVEAIANGRARVRTPTVHLTFDDGYLDNYRSAFPPLRARGIQGTFFLVTSFVGTTEPAWWDKLAYWLRKTTAPEIRLTYPHEYTIDTALVAPEARTKLVLDLLKSNDAVDTEAVLRDVERACGVDLPEGDAARIFMSWDEAREMVRGGMNIGSHTRSHKILSKLSHAMQRAELDDSRRELEAELQQPIPWLAYPVGRRNSFDSTTMALAEQSGYRLAFSYYGGVNRSRIAAYDVRRTTVEMEHTLDWFRWRVLSSLQTGHTEF
jgi:peptidoglycan/xylan/chitin deacetylase (PgdA/CDA1 family)